MKTRTTVLASLLLMATCRLLAQHLEVGAFGSYEDFDRTGFPTNALGVGGRLDINLHQYLQLELESSYDFKHSQFNLVNTISTFTVTQSRMGVLHGNLGLKLQTAGGSFFAFVKGGANRFDEEISVTTATGFPAVSTILQGSERSFTKGVLYPGGGVGFHAGPLGIRFDAGDEIYWDNGARHNLRITFGPTLRF